MNKKRIAREWLYFVGCLAIGIVAIPFILCLIFSPFGEEGFGEVYGGFYSNLWKSLLGGEDVAVEDFAVAWLFVLGPYLLVQLLRSLVWAWKTVRTR